MSDLRKAAEMALEFVEWLCGDDHSVKPKNNALKTREALRQALAQPEQEPVAYVTIEPALDGDWRKCPSIKWFNKPAEGPLYTAPPKQPEQEQYVTKVVAVHEDGTYTTERTPLPKREWVGLTDADKQEAFDETQEASGGFWEFADYLDAKLKEKNT